jgi:hypothetical protein
MSLSLIIDIETGPLADDRLLELWSSPSFSMESRRTSLLLGKKHSWSRFCIRRTKGPMGNHC